ncbi:MAG: methylenetetrahydrofolate reductase [Propionibacteriaceae bacterium]|jgi:methylenetetrahydrofolate reductase (NADPH)|nr:methylenetetrahydrofolate reductase [Propionibacteriaceae bacterium]
MGADNSPASGGVARVEPVAREPVAVEPVAAAGVAVESVAAEPVAAEPVAAAGVRERTATIPELLASGKPAFSFEFFPPADDAGQEQLWLALKLLQPLEPDFVSVTYGANGSTRQRTLDLTSRLARETALRTVGHLTCASQSVAELVDVVHRYGAAGVDHVLAVRGDMPGGATVPWERHPSGLGNATELVRLVKREGDFHVGVAAFCDPHPQRRDPALDARLLLDKEEAGAEFAITQLFFRAASYFELVERVRELGCSLPIVPGIMPITRLGQVTRFAELSGAPIPDSVVARLGHVADDPASVREVGTEVAAELAQELLDGGAPGLHFFTQNRSVATRAIWAGLAPASARARPGGPLPATDDS